ncbi:FAD/NAD(P)-binding domain-containing protein [Lophiostoma macrostomum CBS 122681]|uniref:Kynurenine 3-monooxygenase n=1 Tax=Lophiostoma macrostomum CBS 122681 TaxID=1314788 RepID=A0A6A6T0R9_9PLEO|nr:FAD/NAD(P)-binding domain-containing protein [Lophiostoma macrostomum CBS 122681]
MPSKVVIVGAGPVGSLAALYAAVRGDEVEVYELRPDLRDPETTPLNFAKSINLAISERGINSLRQTGIPEIAEAVLSETTPMHGRMIHVRKNGNYIREAQLYDARGKNLLALDRTSLNKTLLDHIESMPNVKLFFNHKLLGVDFKRKLAWFEHQRKSDPSRGTEMQVEFELMIGADGAHSAVRYHLMKYVPMAYQQEYIDKLWCQFHVPPTSNGEFRLPPNYLHIWPQDQSMFIALPNQDATFTATLFLTRAAFEELDTSGKVVEYFQAKFPGVVPDLITEDELRLQYTKNQHLPLISIKCSPYHFGSSGVIVGDAAHAMVPFYGQGMNAGLEDVRVLFEFLDRYPDDRTAALASYTKQRTPDAQTINDLALRNYQEMASDVKKPLYLLRKKIEETLDLYLPNAGWATQYSRVTFSNMRYSEIQQASQRQAKILNGVVGLTTVFAIASVFALSRSHSLERLKMSVLRSICWVARKSQAILKG